MKIKVTDTLGLDDALKAAQGKASARVLDAQDIARICAAAFAHMGISKKAADGVELHYDGAEHFPAAYRHIPDSTHFKAVFSARAGWVVTEIRRDVCPNRDGWNAGLRLTDAAKAAIVASHECLSV